MATGELTMRRPTVHINLTKLAHKMLASPDEIARRGMTVPRDEGKLLEQLQRERLSNTDAIFRQRYAAWL